MSKINELEKELIDAIADEVVIGEALVAYNQGDDKKLRKNHS